MYARMSSAIDPRYPSVFPCFDCPVYGSLYTDPVPHDHSFTYVQWYFSSGKTVQISKNICMSDICAVAVGKYRRFLAGSSKNSQFIIFWVCVLFIRHYINGWIRRYQSGNNARSPFLLHFCYGLVGKRCFAWLHGTCSTNRAVVRFRSLPPGYSLNVGSHTCGIAEVPLRFVLSGCIFWFFSPQIWKNGRLPCRIPRETCGRSVVRFS